MAGAVICLFFLVCVGFVLPCGVNAQEEGAEAQEKLGHLFLQKGDYDGAAAAFEAALKINPQLKGAQTGKGLVLINKGDLNTAESVLKEALLLNPSPSLAHYALGLVYEGRGDYPNAILQFKEGIKKTRGGSK